tara:strand:- start:840 stop:1031 length:192 start_codon:yes stop_codon:yes gene_type:complete
MMSKEDKKERSLFEEIEQGKNRFTLDDPMGKLVKEAFDLTQLAKKLNQNKEPHNNKSSDGEDK